MDLEPPITPVEWDECWSVVPSREKEGDVYNDIAPRADVKSLHRLERLTSNRYLHENGRKPAIPDGEQVRCAGEHYIMSPFIHLSPSRFSDGGFGVFYGAGSLGTAIAETRHHRQLFLKSTKQPPIVLQMRALVAGLEADLHDLRALTGNHPELFHTSDYQCPRKLGRRLWEKKSWGLIYPSVRDPGGTCVGIFRPKAFLGCQQGRLVQYVWDGEEISVEM